MKTSTWKDWFLNVLDSKALVYHCLDWPIIFSESCSMQCKPISQIVKHCHMFPIYLTHVSHPRVIYLLFIDFRWSRYFIEHVSTIRIFVLMISWLSLNTDIWVMSKTRSLCQIKRSILNLSIRMGILLKSVCLLILVSICSNIHNFPQFKQDGAYCFSQVR